MSDLCTILIHHDAAAPPQKELKEQLEKGNTESKINSLKQIIMLHLNGESQASLLMTFIRFVLPTQDHTLWKLALYFLEIIDKTDSSGKLLPEMILVCNFLREGLNHANEYRRGITLRFVTKLKEEEIVEPLTDSILSNLEHRHSYVRRNAMLAVFTVYQKFPRLLPDAPELVENFLEAESDISSKRNAFLMLFHCSRDRAIRYLRKSMDHDTITSSGDIFQLALVDLLKHLCKTNPQEKSQYLRVIFMLLSSKSPSVLFQCATTLVTLSNSPLAVKEAATTFVNLLSTYGDNNVKLIVLDRLEEIKQQNRTLLEDLLIDLLRCLHSPNMDIRRKILNLTLELVTQRTVEKVVQILKKEVVKTQAEEQGSDRASVQEYRQMLVHAIHQCTMKFPNIAPTIVPVMLDYVTESSSTATEVITFVREILVKYPSLREEVLKKLFTVFPNITTLLATRVTLWIFGVHSVTSDEILHVIELIRRTLQPFPLQPLDRVKPTEKSAEENTKQDSASVSAGTVIRQDGTYVVAIHESSSASAAKQTDEKTFRTMLLNGDFFLAAAVTNTLTKLAIHILQLEGVPDQVKLNAKADVVDLINELLAMGKISNPSIDDDSHERIALCQQLLQSATLPLTQELIDDSKTAFARMVDNTSHEINDDQNTKTIVPADSNITFTQLMKGKKSLMELESAVEDVSIATSNQTLGRSSDFVSRLNRVMQLTGFSDPVYVEATVTVHQFDILLDLYIVNQTNETLQNLTVELATVGDLKLCERATSCNLAPKKETSIKANIKVSSTETGIIFGNVVYDLSSSSNERNCVILNDIHIDIMDYISPAACTPTQFRSMWAEFEWENKVVVNTDIKSLREYLDHIIANTNMKCLTSENSMEGECDFLSANLYAKSSFGEDALANVSIERHPDGKIEGFVRIRSKTQGIALSLGDKITVQQRQHA